MKSSTWRQASRGTASKTELEGRLKAVEDGAEEEGESEEPSTEEEA